MDKPAHPGPRAEDPVRADEQDAPAATGAVTRSTLASATRAMVVGRIVTQGSRLLVSVILARLLAPEAFGVVAVAMTAVLAFEVVKELGTGAAIIQRTEVDQNLLSAVFWFNVLTGALAAAALAAGAPWVAQLFGTPEATDVVRAMALVLLVGGVAQNHHAILRREMRFTGVAAVEMTGALTNGVLSITLALTGAGVWSIVWGTVAGTVAGTVLAWISSRWRPSLRFDPRALRLIAGYSLNFAGYAVTNFLLQNADKWLVGRLLGAGALGIYSMGQRTISYPVQSISQVLMTVLFPAFARIQDDLDALRRGYLRATGAVAFVTFPVMFGAAVVAGPLVSVTLGPQWTELVPLLWFMAPAGALQALLSAVNSVYGATGRSAHLFRWGVASGLASMAAFVVGILLGDLLGLAIAYLLVVVLLFPVGSYFALRLIELPLHRLFRSLAPYAVLTAAMSAVSALVVHGGGRLGWSDPLCLGLAVAAGMLTYLGLALLLRPPALADTLLVVRGRGRWTG